MKTFKTTLIALAFVLLGATAVDARSLAPALRGATDNGDGTYTNWFGTFSPSEGKLSNRDWIDHVEHGKIYISAFGQNLWIYDPNVDALEGKFSGWIYTNRNTFPYFYVPRLGHLIFVSGLEGPAGTPRVFLDRRFNKIFLPKATTKNIVEVAAGNNDFSSLVTAVQTAGLVDALSGDGPFTVFAPDNAAFAQLDPDLLNDLLTNPDNLPLLTEILTYHVIPGRITSEDLGLDVISLLKGATINGYVEMLNGSDVTVDVTPFGILLNGSSMVTAADIEASNGIIHVIDEVLIPPADIVDTAKAAEFNTLVAALEATGLDETLRGNGPFTVFAPTEDAFAALGTDTINALLADLPTLSNILLYHVAGAEVYSANVAPGPVGMVNGEETVVSITDDGTLKINDSNIVVTDIVCANGVIHVIDAVLLPPAG